jgi:hypothetical protein
MLTTNSFFVRQRTQFGPPKPQRTASMRRRIQQRDATGGELLANGKEVLFRGNELKKLFEMNNLAFF